MDEIHELNNPLIEYYNNAEISKFYYENKKEEFIKANKLEQHILMDNLNNDEKNKIQEYINENNNDKKRLLIKGKCYPI